MKSEMKVEKDYVLGKQNIFVDIFKDHWDNHVEIKSSGKCCNRQKSWIECDGTKENENSPTMNIVGHLLLQPYTKRFNRGNGNC